MAAKWAEALAAQFASEMTPEYTPKATLRALLLLQLMRISYSWPHPETQVVADVRDRVVRSFERHCAKALDLGLVAIDRTELRALSAVRLDPDKGNAVCQHLHYLQVGRSESHHWALVHPRVPLTPYAYVCVSPPGYDARRWDLGSKFSLNSDRAAFLARTYCSPLAPRNAVSYLLRRVRKDMRDVLPQISQLVTTVDVELGFTGASYLASGFHFAGRTPANSRLYLDGESRTPGQLFSQYGTADPRRLKQALGPRIEILDAAEPQAVFVMTWKQK